jgi:hypothetical protein
MKVILLIFVILAALIIIACGVWVSVALVKAIMPSRRADANLPAGRRDSFHD